MISHLLLSVATLSFVVALIQPADAKPGGKGQVETTGCADTPTCDVSGLNMTVDYSASTLLGSPLVNARVAWKANVGRLVKPAYRNADASLWRSDGNAAAQKHVRLYDTQVRLKVVHNSQTYHLDADAGVPAQAGGKLSYNVTGSPEWNRMFRNQDGSFVDAGTAKKIMKGGLNVVGASVLSAKVDTSQFEKWWLDKNREKYLQPLRDAVDARLHAMSLAFDLPTEDLRAKVAEIGKTGDATEAVGNLQSMYEKLLPDKLPRRYFGDSFDARMSMSIYGTMIEGSGRALSAAMEELPPLPGSSELYDTWYEAEEVRMKTDEVRVAKLYERKAALEEAERRKREAERRRIEKAKRLAEKRRRKAEARREARRRQWQNYNSYQGVPVARQPSFYEQFTNSLNGSNWGHSSGFGYRVDTCATNPSYCYQQPAPSRPVQKRVYRKAKPMPRGQTNEPLVIDNGTLTPPPCHVTRTC